MGRITSIAALLTIAAGSVALYPGTALSFDGARAREHNSVISSDDFEGRKSGLEGGRKIEQYVADRFAAYGLDPGGVENTWFQEFPLLVTREISGEMELKDGPFGDLRFLLGDDFTLITNSGSGEVTAEVVIVGHGLSDEAREWDDYGDVDVDGRIVVIFRGTPDNGYDWGSEDSRDSTLQEASLRGAAAVLWIGGDRAVTGAAIHDGVYDPVLPLAYVGKRVLDHLFRNTGLNYDQYKKKLKEAPFPFETGAKLKIKTEVKLLGEGKARNVLAMIPGSDPVLATEVIVVGAHLDHIGINGKGLIYNGANDNGSGAAVLLELARSFMEDRSRSKRTILFMGFAAEEQGLLGSKYFAENPTIPLGDIAAMFNFDMVGHGKGTTGIGGGEYFPDMFGAFQAALDDDISDLMEVGRGWNSGGSDHGPFRKKGVPTFNIWSEGDHLFYHDFQDDGDWIDESVLSSVGLVGEELIAFTANWKEPLIPSSRTGYTLLYSSRQIDFDGLLHEPYPPYQSATVRWYKAPRIGKHGFVLDISDMRAVAEGEVSPALVSSVSDVAHQTREGRHSMLIGMEGAALEDLAEERIPLLGLFGVALARWPGFTPATEDDRRVEEEKQLFEQLAEQNVALMIPPDEQWIDKIPEGPRTLVRFFPTKGQLINDPESFPRKSTIFVMSIDEPIDETAIAEMILAIDPSRVHLDLTPWLATGEEEQVIRFLDKLCSQEGITDRIMRDMLGNNLF